MSQPQPYQPGGPPVEFMAPPTNTLAVVSLASGIASYFVVPVLGALVAIITGHMARREIKRTGERGSGFALVGLILGYLHFALVFLLVAVLILVFLIAGAAWFASPHSG